MEEFEKKPPKLYGKDVKLVTQETYLGDEIGMGVAESVNLTIKKRTGLVKNSVYKLFQ